MYYTMPLPGLNAPSVIILESRYLLASSGTTGLRTWEAALHLGIYLCSPKGRAFIKDQTVLELGAGTGFLSSLCAKYLGARHVLATDGSSEVVEDLQFNIKLNGLDSAGVIGTNILKWGHSLDGTLFTTHDIVLGADLVGRVFYKPGTPATGMLLLP